MSDLSDLISTNNSLIRENLNKVSDKLVKLKFFLSQEEEEDYENLYNRLNFYFSNIITELKLKFYESVKGFEMKEINYISQIAEIENKVKDLENENQICHKKIQSLEKQISLIINENDKIMTRNNKDIAQISRLVMDNMLFKIEKEEKAQYQEFFETIESENFNLGQNNKPLSMDFKSRNKEYLSSNKTEYIDYKPIHNIDLYSTNIKKDHKLENTSVKSSSLINNFKKNAKSIIDLKDSIRKSIQKSNVDNMSINKSKKDILIENIIVEDDKKNYLLYNNLKHSIDKDKNKSKKKLSPSPNFSMDFDKYKAKVCDKFVSSKKNICNQNSSYFGSNLTTSVNNLSSKVNESKANITNNHSNVYGSMLMLKNIKDELKALNSKCKKTVDKKILIKK